MNIDQRINQFRLASRDLFNNYFRMENPYGNGDEAWLRHERFMDLQDILFEKLVTEPCSIENVRYGANPQILVRVRHELAEILLNREIDSGYWDHPIKEVTKDATMQFIRFFDWDSLGCCDNEYVRVRVSDWPSQPNVVGKDALVRPRDVIFALAGQETN